MREIKFRAWDSKFGVMLNDVAPYGNYNIIVVDVEFNRAYGDNVDEKYDVGVEEAGFEHVCITGDLVIQQLTGLKDKNGVDIYEGDICRYGELLREIVFEEGCFMSIGYRTNGSRIMSSPFGFNRMADCHEIIGNIHENPELLNNE